MGNERKTIETFNKALIKVRDLIEPKLEAIPTYGPIAYIIIHHLIEGFTTTLEDKFEEVYNKRLSTYNSSVVVATKHRIVKFFGHFPELSEEFKQELDNLDRDLSHLKRAYTPLYKILVVKDILLRTAYADDLRNYRIREIVEDYYSQESKVAKLIKSFDDVPHENREEAFIKIKHIVVASLRSLTRSGASHYSDEMKDILKGRVTVVLGDLL